MNKNSRISILIVSFNRKRDLDACLGSLKPHLDREMEVIILDNGSTDGSPEMVRNKYPGFRIVKWKKNLGLAKALRHLAAIAAGEWFLFLDSDTVIPKSGFKGLIDFAMQHPNIGAVAPRMIDLSGDIQMTARVFPNPLNAFFGRQTLLSRLFPDNAITRRFLKTSSQSENQPFMCDWVAFAAVIVRKQALVEAGSIDPDFFVYWVDADFFKRIKAGGWQVWCYPGCEIHHLEENRQNRARNPLTIKDFHRGALRYFFKHHGMSGLNPFLGIAAAGLWVRMQLQLAINRRLMNKAEK